MRDHGVDVDLTRSAPAQGVVSVRTALRAQGTDEAGRTHTADDGDRDDEPVDVSGDLTGTQGCLSRSGLRVRAP